MTLVLSRKLRGLGPWIEQLLAESLGKDGKGLVPVDDEPLGPPGVYGEDRVFVAVTLEGDAANDAELSTLEDAGHPVIRIGLREPLEVGAEFFRWELATAAAGVALGVNPFDEPDVTRAKENTASLLGAWKKSKKLPEWPADAEENGVVLMTNSGKKPAGVSQGIQAFLAQAQAGDYIALQAYLAPTADTWTRLQELRLLLRDRLKLATTVAFGPRYLHSTGQLHKGGPAQRHVHPDHGRRQRGHGHSRRGLRLLHAQSRPGPGRPPGPARCGTPGVIRVHVSGEADAG